ncbi:MAG TPA: SDR family oxidoreductase [Chitinophagales bacterium]|nr:SDR family oxidoreductase [Chitinophagales bacterium]
MKNYVVIGGTAGIGLAVTQQLSSAGHSVQVISRTNRNIAELQGVTHSVWDAAGTEPLPTSHHEVIHGLIYCPGSINLKPFHRLAATDFATDYKINVEGAVKAIQHFLPMLKAAPQASVLLFSTVAVQTGMPFHASIAAAKGAVEGLTRALAAELAPKVCVNCIAPSLVQTELSARLTATDEKIQASAQRHPLARIGQPGDIAGMATQLLANPGWLTGQVIHIDGGMSALRV